MSRHIFEPFHLREEAMKMKDRWGDFLKNFMNEKKTKTYWTTAEDSFTFLSSTCGFNWFYKGSSTFTHLWPYKKRLMSWSADPLMRLNGALKPAAFLGKHLVLFWRWQDGVTWVAACYSSSATLHSSVDFNFRHCGMTKGNIFTDTDKRWVARVQESSQCRSPHSVGVPTVQESSGCRSPHGAAVLTV